MLESPRLRPIPPVELQRDTATERQFGLVVRGQALKPPVLGLIAIRCRRHGASMEPLTLSIPDTPPVDQEWHPVYVRTPRLRLEEDGT